MPPISVLSREERDLLITLKTKMDSIEKKLDQMDAGLTGRVLNLESNAVTKLVVDDIDDRVRTNENWRYILIGAFALMQIEIPIGMWLVSQIWK